MGRCLAGLVIVVLLQPLAAHATTANSLSGRVVIDGVLNEYASDEWVLDTSTTLPETERDSAWGSDNDVTRVALTWDRTYLYVGVEGRAFDSFLSLFLFNRAGGLTTLDNAGEFRRAIDLPSPVNLMALAAPGALADVARADDSHPFALVDRGAILTAVTGVRTGKLGFEMAVPWSMLTLARPVALVAAITGETGTGAGDAAPDASARSQSNRFVRTVLDRWFEIEADIDHDGLADIGIAPRSAGRVEPDTTPATVSGDAQLGLNVSARAIAPERGESTVIDIHAAPVAPVFVTLTVYSLEGRRVRALLTDERVEGDTSATWDGRDDRGGLVRGGTYVVVADWGGNRGEHAGRAKTAVVVAR